MRRERGVALITALLVTALAVTLVSGMFWQQQVQVRALEAQRLRLQARLLLAGVLEQARLALPPASVTTLDGGWTAPLRLRSSDSGVDSGSGVADLSQRISDAQARFNLRSLASPTGVNAFQVAAFGRLLHTLRLDPQLAHTIADAVAPRAPDARMALAELDDLLAVPGISPAILDTLREHVTVLPEPTAINVNTASPEVLTAVARLTLAEARAVVAQRTQAHFRNTSDFALRLAEHETLEGVDYQVSSSYFLVSSQVALDRVRLDARTLVRRSGQGAAIVWTRIE